MGKAREGGVWTSNTQQEDPPGFFLKLGRKFGGSFRAQLWKKNLHHKKTSVAGTLSGVFVERGFILVSTSEALEY